MRPKRLATLALGGKRDEVRRLVNAVEAKDRAGDAVPLDADDAMAGTALVKDERRGDRAWGRDGADLGAGRGGSKITGGALV